MSNIANFNFDNKENQAADSTAISLSQAILSPLDALFKAQIHSARSFLNLLFQMGYPHDTDGVESKEPAYSLDFKYSGYDKDGKEKAYIISVPTLALAPLAPLTIDSAEFKFGMSISHIAPHDQIQAQRAGQDNSDNPQKRDWFLVKDPVSMKGVISKNLSGADNSGDSQTQDIQISVKLSKAPIPAALDKLLTTLSQNATIKEMQ